MEHPEDTPAPSPSALQVVLIDSRDERRALMVDVVEGNDDRMSVAAAADGHDSALFAVDELRPEGVVIDVRMPTEEGLRTIADLRGAFPGLAIVVCSFDLDRQTRQRVIDAGADACIAKPASHTQLLGALEAARLRWDATAAADEVPAAA